MQWGIVIVAAFFGLAMGQPSFTLDGRTNTVTNLGAEASRTGPFPTMQPSAPSPTAFGASTGSVGVGSCTKQEKKAIFDNCLFEFGFSHMSAFDLLRRWAPKCRVDVFRCSEVDKMSKCLNTQPKSVVSDKCWAVIGQVMTSSLREYGIPCTNDQIETHCANKFTPLLPASKRKTSGMGVQNNPMQRIMSQVYPMIMMMMQTGQYGMFAPIAQAFGA